MKKFIQAGLNGTATTNGDKAYKSTLNAVLDLFAAGVTSPNKHELVKAALIEDPILAIKCALYLRDVREGQGNRDIYQVLMRYIPQKFGIKVIQHTPEFGSWKDLLKLLDNTDNPVYVNTIVDLIKEHFETNALLAKWLPRQGRIAKFIIDSIEIPHGKYRRHIAKLSKTVEQSMCAGKWHEITYEHVPSLANNKYSNAFKRNDSSRYEEYLNRVKSGETTANVSTLYPHEIAYSSAHGKDALWSQLPQLMPDSMNILPVIDLSCSMTWREKHTPRYLPIEIATGLGLYFAENNHGALQNIVMSFADRPQITQIAGATVDDRLQSIRNGQVGYSTNIEVLYGKVLELTIESGEDVDSLLIISDMQFNQACHTPSLSTFQLAKDQFEAAGKKFPIIIFWNVNAKYGTHPVTQHESGSILVDGYSPTILKSLFKGDLTNYTPLNAMLEVLDPKYTWLS